MGTRTFLLVDERRPDGESPLGNGFRTLSIRAWYPAQLSANDQHTTYLRSDISFETEVLVGPPAWFNGGLDHVPTFAYWNAKISKADKPYPAILDSGSGNASLLNVLFEELASQGYVAISISHPHWNNVLFDDQGQVVTQAGVDERYEAWFKEKITPAVQEAKSKIPGGRTTQDLEEAQTSLNATRPVAISEMRQYSEDNGFVLE